MGFLDNKRALIVGVASNRSIAWGIAKAMHREGAELAFTYQNDRLKGRVEKFAAELGSELTMPCDVGSDDEIDSVYRELGKHWDGLDILIHSAAFAPREQLEGSYLDSVTREGFLMAHDISSYSFAALGKAAKAMMKGRNGAMLTLTYIGAVRSMPNYNVMGVAKASLEANIRYMAASLGPENIRVNGISAGPIRTLAASGISGLKDFLHHVEKASPLRRNVTIDEVGNAAAFLCSDLASAITGEITYVDCGYNSIGMS
ncbi:MAG: enoyl-ACP reductase [Gammaproteobacteria bacterium]|nr:MAG: enoyl-ACP reductase [Gammaproteobacteria bacterium]